MCRLPNFKNNTINLVSTLQCIQQYQTTKNNHKDLYHTMPRGMYIYFLIQTNPAKGVALNETKVHLVTKEISNVINAIKYHSWPF